MRNEPMMPFGGYYQRDLPEVDKELTSVGPSTPAGEYLRRFWTPVCLTAQLTDVPLAIRVMGEDLVAFRDRSGRIGILARHCCHRGASLEFGIIQERGIRCCYHGMQFDIDGALLSVACEPDNGQRLTGNIYQGAYPAVERDGLVFAYMGPPDTVPPFPEWDAFDTSDEVRLRAFSNIYPCNWLQVAENIADQMHTAILHQPGSVLYNGAPPADIDLDGFTVRGFAAVPVMDYLAVREGGAMAFIAGRRTAERRVWWRVNECALPNMTHHAYVFEDGRERRLFHRVSMSRWHVPVDNEQTIIFGWRMFGASIDPYQKGREERVGFDDMDFLEGQTGNRPYRERQRVPGDWEAIVSQRPIAVHALEHPLRGDTGVYLFRKLLREAIRGTAKGGSAEQVAQRLRSRLPLYTYTQNTILDIPRAATAAEDADLIRAIGRRIVDITAGADQLPVNERKIHITRLLEKLELEYSSRI